MYFKREIRKVNPSFYPLVFLPMDLCRIYDEWRCLLLKLPNLHNDNELNSAELKQIAYWKPETIGELIFNFWD
jgi:hypothetical protein